MAQGSYFHTFDALRFFAFFKVFLFHLPFFYPGAFNFIARDGEIAVQFFFVLSGFLITYLIISEKKRTGGLNLKHFFARRALRIWPLYYLMVAFAFATPYILSSLRLDHSDEGYQPNFLYSLLFLENYVTIAEGGQPNVSPLGVMWSVCVEEHFYIAWGIALYLVATRHLPKLILACVGIALVSRIVFVSCGYRTLDLLTNLDLFAFGAIPAYLLVERQATFEGHLNGLRSDVKIVCVVGVIAIALIAPHFPGAAWDVLSPIVLGMLFAGMLALFLPQQTSFRISDGSIFTKLGKYTYGLYLYHTIVINFLANMFRRVGYSLDRPVNSICFAVLALCASIAISMVSYRYFERPFLSFKKYVG